MMMSRRVSGCVVAFVIVVARFLFSHAYVRTIALGCLRHDTWWNYGVTKASIGSGAIIGQTVPRRRNDLSFLSCLSSTRSNIETTSPNELSSTPTPDAASSTANTSSQLGAPICIYHVVDIPTSQKGIPPQQAISVEDLTPIINRMLEASSMLQGVVHVISRHTTTAITINERESRLAQDIAQQMLRLLPPDERSLSLHAKPGVRYMHNDLDQRPESIDEVTRCRDNGWNIDDPTILQAWRDQEPINAHSHLIAMMLGSTECIPVSHGKLVLGQWQSILLVDLDGPRDRTVGVQLMGYQ